MRQWFWDFHGVGCYGQRASVQGGQAGRKRRMGCVLAKGSRVVAGLRRTIMAAAAAVVLTSLVGGVATAAPASPAPSGSSTAPTPSTPGSSDSLIGAEPKSVGPGDRIDILQRSLGGGRFEALQCTVGFAVISPSGERLGVTAGHCGAPEQPVGVSHWIVGEVVQSKAPAVKPDPKRPGQFTPVDPFGPDWATFRITDNTVKLLGAKGPITPRSVGVAHVGDKVCQLGSVNGYRCGAVVKVQGNWILTDIKTTPGDSGGPLVRTSDGAALGIITDAVTLSDATTGKVTGNATQYYALPAVLAAAGGDRLATN